jgi:predicted acyl esterase
VKRALCIVLALLVCGGILTPAHADPVPNDATWEQVWFPSDDGTMLHADVLLPKDRADNERHPVILSIGPYFGSGGSVPPSPTRTGPVMRFQDLIDEGRIFERGYAYVQVDSRGYGGSDGCNDFGGPGEQMDAKAAVEWAAKQDWSNGKVGMWGKSYDGWTQVMALSQKPKGLAAVVIQSPLIETYRGMFMNGVHYDSGWYATPSLYADYDLTPPSLQDSPPEEFLYPAKGTATNPHCYALNISMTTQPDHSLAYWQERDIIKAASKSRVPVMWSHGFLDANTKPSNLLPVWSKLRGPKRAWFGQYDHVRGNEADLVGRDGFMDEAMDWFAHYLMGEPLVEHPAIEIQDNEGAWRTESSWPPSDARYFRLYARKGIQYPDMPGNSADAPDTGGWGFFTEAAPYDLHFAGPPKFEGQVGITVPGANLIALLYDIGPDGDGRLITRGAYRLMASGKVSFDLYPEDWRVHEGHRIGLYVSGSDDTWFTPTNTSAMVGLNKAIVSLPFLSYLRTTNLEGGPADAMSGVPTISVNEATIDAYTTPTKFPPRLKKR